PRGRRRLRRSRASPLPNVRARRPAAERSTLNRVTDELRELLRRRAGEDLELFARHVNPQMVRVLRTIGFDREWERTEGAYLYDSAGNRYLDWLGGFGMFNVGRNNRRVREWLVEALELETPNAVQMGVSP